MTWATIEDVKNITGRQVEAETLALAVELVGLHIGVVPEEGVSIAGRDGKIVKRMVAFEAAWLPDQPDLLERMNIASSSQDGQSVTLKKDGLTLAPLAALARRRLSWQGTRSTTQEAATKRITDDDDVDTLGRPLPWKPLR